jgi:hypothetical protein
VTNCTGYFGTAPEGDNNLTKKRDALQKQIEELGTERETTAKEAQEAQKTLPKWPENLPVESLTLATGDQTSSP